MNILATDDSRLSLEGLTSELGKVFKTASIMGELSGLRALGLVEELKENGESLDFAFLCIRSEDMDGLELGRQIRKLYPKAALIFCTAYPEYAIDAFSLFAKGYLLKPVSAEGIRRTLEEMVYDHKYISDFSVKDIRVQTFGHFDIFVDGKPLHFEREKAKEMLAYLIDRHGSTITTEQIAAVLWESRNYDCTLKNYVSKILGSLRKTLDEAGIGDIIIKTKNHLSVDMTKLRCDAYDYELGDSVATNAFKGEYMINYSWAEFTVGRYTTMKNEKKGQKQ